MLEVNVSLGKDNYSQRNNEIDSNNVCGPTNFIQALTYAGWVLDESKFPQFKQPEDKLTYFCRTNKDVLNYFKTHYANFYNNWMTEAKANAKAQKKEYWQVACKNSYPPNELHDVMSYAVNLFVGYSAKDLAGMKRRPVTRFYNEFDIYEVIWQLCKGLPVISSVDPFKRGGGHYITIVGFTAADDFAKPVSYNQVTNKEFSLDRIYDIIIDNTYGKFDFANKKYLAVSGNDEHLTIGKLLDIVKPVSHYFSPGAAVVC